jgi:hypothetical protein
MKFPEIFPTISLGSGFMAAKLGIICRNINGGVYETDPYFLDKGFGARRTGDTTERFLLLAVGFGSVCG